MWEVQAVLISLLVCLLVHLLKLSQPPKSYPPGPFWLPIIGCFWYLVIAGPRDPFIKVARRYGNVCTLWLGSKCVVILSGFQAVKEGIINHSEEMGGRLVSPYIYALTKGKGQPLDPALLIRSSISNVICALAFGHRYSAEDKEFLQMVEATKLILTYSVGIFYALYEILPWLMKHLPGSHQKAFSCLEAMVSFAKKEIEEHKKYHSMHEPQDFIDFYMLQIEKSKKDPDSTYSEENLAHCIVDLFIAGSDTTASTLQWALLLMANHPDVQEKVHQEIDRVLDSAQSFSYQDVKKLPYTNAVIHEIQRSQYVLLYGIGRQCVKDVNIFGFLLPKGTYVIPDIRSVLHDPTQWEKSEAFNPNHFLDKDENFRNREEFLPFGSGARTCLGEQLARIELFIFFTSLLRAFTFQLPKGVKELSQEYMIGFITPPCPYKLCAVPRCGAL